MQITSDIELSGAGCTTAITPNQLVQSSSENDREITKPWGKELPRYAWLLACSVSRKDDSPQSPASVDFLLWHPIQQIRNGEQRRLNTQIQLKSDFVMTDHT
ncbi:hypothetical protein [Aeromonas veronii]|uniref:hypothetical protein n=1 Tax=Aeromonas veronii TaxID=654 RepID=UPI003D19FA66